MDHERQTIDIVSPDCSPTPPQPLTRAQQATAFARTLDGETIASPEIQALFRKNEWAPGPPAEWAGDCVKIPYAAWHAAGVEIERGHAINNYTRYNRDGLIAQGEPPIGAVVFYAADRSNRNKGHTALSIGGGMVVTTNGNDGDGTANSIEHYLSATDAKYLGYYLPG